MKTMVSDPFSKFKVKLAELQNLINLEEKLEDVYEYRFFDDLEDSQLIAMLKRLRAEIAISRTYLESEYILLKTEGKL